MVQIADSADAADIVQEPDDFDAFYRDNFRAVVALVYGLSGSRSAAEELAQEAFLAAYRGWTRIGAYDDPGAWVRRVAVNRSVSGVRRRVAEAKAMTRLRSRRVEPEVLPEQADGFWRAVRSLPRRQAQVVALHYVEDRSIADIAAICEIAEGTVKAHLFKARATLAERLGVSPEEDS